MSTFTPVQINSFFPVIGLTVYNGGVTVKRHCVVELWGKMHKHERGKIVKISARSLNRLALLVRSSGIQFTSLMTLTYGQNYPLSGRIAKKHLNTFFVDARRKFGPFEYFWVVEFQGRGAIHFHVATTLPPPTFAQREIFADMWARISQPEKWDYCPLKNNPRKNGDVKILRTDLAAWDVHLHSKAWEAVREQDGMQRYIAKYANKLKQKKVPEHFQDVGRFWATSTGVKMPQGEFFYASDSQVREVLTIQGREIEHWPVLPKTVLVG